MPKTLADNTILNASETSISRLEYFYKLRVGTDFINASNDYIAAALDVVYSLSEDYKNTIWGILLHTKLRSSLVATNLPDRAVLPIFYIVNAVSDIYNPASYGSALPTPGDCTYCIAESAMYQLIATDITDPASWYKIPIGSSTLGKPPFNKSNYGLVSLGRSTAGLLEGDTIEIAFDKVDSLLGRLVPPPPPDLSTMFIVILNSRPARLAANMPNPGTVYPYVYDANQGFTPIGIVAASSTSTSLAFFGDADAGELEAYINSESLGSTTLTPASDVGSYRALEIVEDTDPYAGQPNKENIYKALKARIVPTTGLNLGFNTYTLRHSLTAPAGKSVEFLVDLISSSRTITGASFTANTVRYLSGIPVLYRLSTCMVRATLNNFVSKAYNPTRLASVNVTGKPSISVNYMPAAPPAENSSVTFNNLVLPLNSLQNEYIANFSVEVKGYTYREQVTNVVATYDPPNKRVIYDDLSLLESANASDGLPFRLKNNGEHYPNSEADFSPYDSTQDLDSSGNIELCYLNNRVFYPADIAFNDFTNLAPVSGYNYRNLSGLNINGSEYRCFLRRLPDYQVSSANQLILNIVSPFNFPPKGTSVLTPDFLLYVKVFGTNGTTWVSANDVDFNNGNLPVGWSSGAVDGIPGIILTASTVSRRFVSFGNPGTSPLRSGNLYVLAFIKRNASLGFSNIVVGS